MKSASVVVAVIVVVLAVGMTAVPEAGVLALRGTDLSGSLDVPFVEGVSQWLLRLAAAARES